MRLPFASQSRFLSSRLSATLAIGGVAAIVAIDVVTPPDLEMTPLYVAPIVLVALRGVDRQALSMALLCGLAASGMDQLEGRIDLTKDALGALSLAASWMSLFSVIGLGVSSWVQRHRVAAELERALAEVQILRGLLPICAWCRRVREDGGGAPTWHTIEEYLHTHAHTRFTHGICPSCAATVVRQQAPPARVTK
jgi:hypothetical protein